MNLPALRRKPVEVERDQPSLSLQDYVNLIEQFTYGGLGYSVPGAGYQTTYPGSKQEVIGPQFRSLAALAYKTNPVVFACMGVRMRLFSEARFQWQQLRTGGPGNLFGTPELQLLEEPWTGGTTGDLLTRMIQHADIGGNAFVTNRGTHLSVLRPDWMTIILGSRTDPDVTAWDVDAEILGYIYQEGGVGSSMEPETFLAEEVAHFAPIPDPEARFRGMSWLTPVIREVMADKQMTEHRLQFFENAATPNLMVTLDVPDLTAFEKWMQKFHDQHAGAHNAYKTMFMAAGADAKVIGTDLHQLEFKVTQGAGETRIAAAAGVPPVIVGLSEGLQAATYSNYGQARRALADATLWPLWRNVAGSLARIVTVPAQARLWIDASGIAFLREDEADAATIQNTQAQSIKLLVDVGFESQSVIDAITSGDFSRLEHTGLFSVQLQPAGTVGQGKGSLFTGVTVPGGMGGQPTSGTQAVPASNGNGRDLLPLELLERLVPQHEQLQLPINLTIHLPEVTFHNHPPDIQVESPQVTVEPVRFDEGAIQVHMQNTQPDVNVTLERSGKRRVEFSDGTGATVTEGDTKTVEYDDGKVATITEVEA